jgi:hypothetical protein
MPCALGPRFDEASPEEQARILRETYWTDFVTNSEWPALLGHDDAPSYARSRLKKKAAGWLIALGRIAVLNPDLIAEIVERATATYEEQTETEYPAVQVGGALVSLPTFRNWIAQGGSALTINVWIEDDVPAHEDTPEAR